MHKSGKAKQPLYYSFVINPSNENYQKKQNSWLSKQFFPQRLRKKQFFNAWFLGKVIVPKVCDHKLKKPVRIAGRGAKILFISKVCCLKQFEMNLLMCTYKSCIYKSCIWNIYGEIYIRTNKNLQNLAKSAFTYY